ncbi:hypothetical protein AGDE_07688 [Angomonas deanei]|uniref:Uncharacterized protein n=1 Tax=Angomonas deanei TaxID=59799 RepID=A0A7G2CK02_9TRYP|nr:hypothetical protein AGDE_07688 [Angomonas deanei]CAD2220200.1 hypothetical protein, conserved [Angomonas deanei]|eukprot:EPY34948.1 hypothetical protein AGDE_07688 [Angomonas deanei]
MFPLDLYASPTAVAQVYTVLQGELGLAVYTPNEGVQTEKDHVYLFSPDATSCVVVACRVRLNPLIPVEEQQQPLLGKLQSTVAATMAHFDRPEDLSDRLHEMLYSTALPAWVHAVTEVYQQAAAEGDVLSYLRQRLPTAETPLLQVEWYVMGGVRMELSAAPVLEGIWKTFFPPSPKPKTKGEKVERPLSSLLKSEVSIADVMAHYEGELVSLTMRHRLQEDGVCCWSFDTFMAPWRLDTQRISRRYANAACFGLLLQVSGVTPGDEEGGRCWPAEVAAGRRGYVMGTFRGMLIEDYRWLCPLEKDQSAVEQDGDHSLRLVRNTVQTEKVKSLVEKSASPFLSLSLLSGDGETVRLTLKEFVQRFLEAVRTNNTLLYSATSEGGKPNNNNQYMGSLSLLPLILRRKAAFVHSTGQEEDAPLEWWQRDFEEDLDAIPADTFLGFSTTPHCEPPDFPELMRSHFKMREATSSCDLFVP